MPPPYTRSTQTELEPAPELNPAERVWQFLKPKLAWKNCATLTQLKELVASHLKTFSSEVIASLTSYDFILEVLFGTAL